MYLSNTDQAAVGIMLSAGTDKQKQAALDSLIERSAIAHGLRCEECGSERVEDNGARGVELTFCCTECGHQWSPNI